MEWILVGLAVCGLVAWLALGWRSAGSVTGRSAQSGDARATATEEEAQTRLAAASPLDGAAERVDPAFSRLDRGPDEREDAKG